MKTDYSGSAAVQLGSILPQRRIRSATGGVFSEETVRYAAVVMMMYITLCIGGALAISYLEGLPILSCI